MSTAAREDSVEIELAVDRFEDAWERGGRPVVADYLPEGEHPTLLVELVHVELERRLKAGEPVRVEEYLHRYPELGRDPGVFGELIAAEFRLRRQLDPTLTLGEYSQRFPERTHELPLLLSEGKNGGPPSTQQHPSGEVTRNGSPGARLDGEVSTQSHYRVLRPHARGGLGEILLARDEGLQREVALKLLQRALGRNPEARRRFLWEAKITGQLEHPGIVPLYGVGEASDGSPVYAMRFIRGETLQDAVRNFYKDDRPGRDPGQRSLVFRQLLGRFLSVCNTVAYAHSRGVIHRDLKPGNIMLGEYGETIVVDWGLAKRVGGEPANWDDRGASASAADDPTAPEGTRDGVIVGTPVYMSPEQAAGKWTEVGPTSDTYSLGATLYVLLTGTPPFDDGPVGELLEKVRRGRFPPPRLRQKNVPPALEAICLKALAARPEDRYPSALALASDLEHWLADEPVGAWPEPTWVAVRRWISRHTAVVTGGGIAVIAGACLVAVTAFLLAANEQERSDRELAQEKARQQEKEAEVDRQRAQEDRKRLEQADRDFYFHHITWADREWLDNNFPAAERRLEECARPELRNWEWYYLRRRCEGSLLTLNGHQQEVWRVEYSPDGKRLASASLDGTVKLWDTTTGRLLRTFDRHQGAVWGVAFTPDGKRLVSGGKDRVVRCWDVETGQEVRTFATADGEVRTVALSADGQLLAAACVAGDGRNIEPGQVHVWDTDTGKERLTLAGHAGGAYSVAFRPDGQQLCSGGMDRLVKVWEVKSGNLLLTLRGSTREVHSAAYSPNGQVIAAASQDGGVRVWDAANGRILHMLAGHTAPAWGVAFRPDGKQLASSSDDTSVRIWDLERGRPLLVLWGHAGGIANIAYSPAGTRLASACDDRTVRLWDPSRRRDGQILSDLTGPVSALVFSADSRRLAAAANDRTVKIWDLEKGQKVRTFNLRANAGGIALSPDGRLLAVAGDDGDVTLWDLETKERKAILQGHLARVCGVAFHPDGKRLASVSEDKTVKIWDVVERRELVTLREHTGKVNAVVFSPDGRRLVTCGDDATVRTWDATTGTAQQTFRGHRAAVLGLAISPDGRRVASCSALDKRVVTWEPGDVRLWDLDTGQELQVLHGHMGSVCAVAFSPDGERLVSASDDHRVNLWEPATGQEILTLADHQEAVLCVTFSPDGRRLASAGANGNIIVRNGMPGE